MKAQALITAATLALISPAFASNNNSHNVDSHDVSVNSHNVTNINDNSRRIDNSRTAITNIENVDNSRTSNVRLNSEVNSNVTNVRSGDVANSANSASRGNETSVRVDGDTLAISGDTLTIHGDRFDTRSLALATQALANMPTAQCQGESSTVGATGNAGFVGGSLGLGKSKVDQQCTLRETVRILAVLTATVDYNYATKLAAAVGRLEGAQPVGEPGVCVKLIYKGKIEKAKKLGCTIR
jgi:CCR4-NOT transcriptional regulation complex NOT5 subunit